MMGTALGCQSKGCYPNKHLFIIDVFSNRQTPNEMREGFPEEHVHHNDLSDMTVDGPVDFQSPIRPWNAWTYDLDSMKYELCDLITQGCEITFTGNLPLALVTYLAQMTFRPITILAQNPPGERVNSWETFRVSYPLVGDPPALLEVRQVCELQPLQPEDQHPLWPILFVSLNKDYSLTNNNISQIQGLLTGVHTPAVWELKPERSTFLLGKEHGEDATDIAVLARDIERAYRQVFRGTPNMNGLALVMAVPQIVAYLLGMLWKYNVYGEFIVVERVGAEYQLVPHVHSRFRKSDEDEDEVVPKE